MEPQKIKYTQSLFRNVNTTSHHNLELQIEIISRIKIPPAIKLKVGDTVSIKGRQAVIVAMKIVSAKNKAGRRVMISDWDVAHSVENNLVIILNDGTITRGNNIRP